MKKRDVYKHPVGSPDFVVAHAIYKEKRGKRPSMPYKGERNPRKALKMALVDLGNEILVEGKAVVEAVDLLINVNPKNETADTSFGVIIGLKKNSSHKTFPEAFECFHEEIMKAVKQGTTYRWLETSNYIKHTVKTLQGPVDCSLNFFKVRDLAFIVGALTKEGKIQKPPFETSPMKIDLFFLEVEEKNREWLYQQMEQAKKT